MLYLIAIYTFLYINYLEKAKNNLKIFFVINSRNISFAAFPKQCTVQKSIPIHRRYFMNVKV